MTAKEMEEILHAFNEGKDIEVLGFNSRTWETTKNIYIILDYLKQGKDIRIVKIPTYVPYANAEEFLKAQKEHGPYLRKCIRNAYDTYLLPVSVVGNWVDFNATIDIVNGKCETEVTIYRLLDDYIWQDGTPCGILK